MKKRVAILLAAALLAVAIIPAVMAAGKPLYSDLPEGHWSYDYVTDLSRRGVINGYPDGTFQPKKNVTYGETFKLILLAVGVDEPAPQSEKHWAYPYIKLAVNNLLVYSFDADKLDTVPTRLEVARMAARAMDLTDISGDSPYDDCDDGYVVKLFEKNIMDGFLSDGGSRSFRPDKPISREEIAAIIWRMTNTDVTKGMFKQSGWWVDVLDGVPATTFSKSQFTVAENGRLTYSGGYYARGIDVSRYQGDIDWEAAAGDGIDFAIIRAGYRTYGSGVLMDDVKFDDNMRGAIDAGVDLGAYYFSNAINVEEAVEEADALISKLEPYRENITYPVVCDWEIPSGARVSRMDGELVTKCIAAFCRRVEEAGYTPMVYFNPNWGYTKMDLRELVQYPFWLAHYTNTPSFIYNYQMWQYSSTSRVAGISGDVDMNLCFVTYGNGDHFSGKQPDPEPAESEPVETEPAEPESTPAPEAAAQE